jgi:ankyrin repeat protein
VLLSTVINNKQPFLLSLSLPDSLQKGHLDAVEFLLASNAYPNFMEATGNRSTPLDYAAVNNHQAVVDMLTAYGGLPVATIQELAATSIQAAYVAKCRQPRVHS